MATIIELHWLKKLNVETQNLHNQVLFGQNDNFVKISVSLKYLKYEQDHFH